MTFVGGTALSNDMPRFEDDASHVDSGCELSQDMFLPALATVPAAWALAYVPRFIKLGIIYGRTQRMSLWATTPNLRLVSGDYIHTYIHTYMHTYIHTYVRTYIHTYVYKTYLPSKIISSTNQKNIFQ